MSKIHLEIHPKDAFLNLLWEDQFHHIYPIYQILQQKALLSTLLNTKIAKEILIAVDSQQDKKRVTEKYLIRKCENEHHDEFIAP